MILTLIALGLTLIGLTMSLIARHNDEYEWEFGGWCGVVVFGIWLLFALGQVAVVKKIETDVYIIKFDTIRDTFETARTSTNISALELATIQRDVVERNVWLAKSKYWAKHPLTSWFWDKRIFEIEPIK